MPQIIRPAMPSMRHPRRMARERFRKFLRVMKYARDANLRVLYVCRTCEAPLQLKRGTLGLIETDAAHTGTINEKTDDFSLTCKCTVWTVGK